MGTELRSNTEMEYTMNISGVKLNNPPMGTELGIIPMNTTFTRLVKLNNPPMGTETWLFMLL